ncbi:hypothetical protein [Methylomonas koyamae]|uniref:hypothetical protein n=1 Tax=Methylomonas koyamae TaxID=702114 RepID=UPI000BC300C4|nr:hypothetical protein [Methylomonas koyamae]ATG88401.1 hypothetical protein MKLM6_0116 [Methylomonas koyamae]
MVEQFATIVGLVSAFSSGRGAKQALDIAEFQAWLFEHNHGDIVKFLNSDTKVTIFVKAYLNQQIPEIQSKLDTIINLVQVMVGNSEADDVEYTGKHFLKGVVLLGLERVMSSGLQSEEFDIAHSYVCEMIGDHSYYNKYVLEKMVRDCLQRKNSASHVMNTYWLDLVE